MPVQISIDFNPVHQRENTAENQAFLDEHRDLFNKSCWCVFKALMEGYELTTDNAYEIAATRSLPRRVLDLRDAGYHISDIKVGSCKKWFMSEDDKKQNAELIIKQAVVK